MEMREYRMGLIQTPEQLQFSYKAIIEGTKQIFSENSEPSKVIIYFSNDYSIITKKYTQ